MERAPSFDEVARDNYNINWRDSMFGFAKTDDFINFVSLCDAVVGIRDTKFKDVLSVHDMQKKTLYMTNVAHCKDPGLKILNYMYDHDVDFNNTDSDGHSLLHYMDMNKNPGMKKYLHDFIMKKSGILYTDEKLKLNM